MSDFNFFLNRQGIQGRKGDKGDAGFTPTISVSEQTLNSYKLKITNEYNEFETPNLIGNLGVTDNGGTYLRYDPTTGTVSTGEIDGATTEIVGGVRKSTDADLTNLSADTAVTPANVADMLPLLLEAGTDNVTITQDEATSKTKISVKGGSGSGDVTAAGDNRFTGDNTFTGKVNIAGGALTVDGVANLNQATAQYLNAVSITSSGEVNAVSIKANGLRSDDIQTNENKKYLTELDVDNQTIQVVNGKLHANLDELGNEVNSLTGEVNSLSGDVTSLTGDVTSLTGEVTNLTGRVTNLTDGVNSLSGKVTSLTGDVSDLTGRVTVNEADISAMKTGKQNKLTAGSNITLTNLTDGTVRIDSTGGGGTGDIPIATTTTAGKVKPDGTTITITDDGTISAVGGGGATIDDSTTATTSVWSSSKTNTEITTVANEVVQVQGDVASLDSDVSTLKTDVSGIKTDVSKLKTDVSGLKTDVSGLKTNVQNAITGADDQTFDLSGVSTKPAFTKRWKFRSAPDVYQQVQMYQAGIVFDDLCAKTLKINPSITGNLITGGLQLDFTSDYGKVSTQGRSSDKLVLKGGSGQEIIVGSGTPKVNIGNYPASQTLHPILTSYNTKAGNGISITTEGDNVTISATGGGGSAPTNMVTTDTAQDITANKTFYGEIRIGTDNNYATLAKFSKEALVSGNSTLQEHIDLGEADFVVQGSLGKKVYETDKYVYKKYINVDDLSDNQIKMDNSISSQVAHMAMPSDKYIDLTLGASGTTYTAPADGWFSFRGTISSNTNSYWDSWFINDSIVRAGFTYIPSFVGDTCSMLLPAKTGDILHMSYAMTFSNIDHFRFYYTEGSQPTQ